MMPYSKESQGQGARRPRRASLPDFAGRPLTLPDTAQSWRFINPDENQKERPLLLLGLGPDKAWKLPFISPKTYWLESPRTLSLLRSLPDFSSCPSENEFSGQWLAASMDEALHLARHCRACFYMPGFRLDPDFWGEFFGKLDARELLENSPGEDAQNPSRGRAVWLPGHAGQLLHWELREALLELGFENIYSQAEPAPAKVLAENWGGNLPELLLSVNFRGLDAEGKIFHLCRALDIPLAIWLVDNPWHLLSGISCPWWKEAKLFLSDPGFIPPLAAAGAKHVWHLPLAASQHMWREMPENFDPSRSRPLFVGRSAFPDKAKFFGGARLPTALLDEALRLCEINSALPDYHWWSEKLAISPWPGTRGRAAGLGAEDCSAFNRASWLSAALPLGLEIVGDEGWHDLLPQARILPPVDYYGVLPDLYARASAVLNVTSLLLPHSLNQRHFDVWAAGGLLLSDRAGGLEMFPKELREPMILDSPGDFALRLAAFQKDPAARKELILAWREHLRHGHGYADRLKRMFDLAGRPSLKGGR